MNTNWSLKKICILGIQRSGTSTITRALNIIGVSIGEKEDLMAPSIDNPKGYWENNKIVSIHEQIFRSFSRNWDTLNPLPNDWWKRDEILTYKNSLIKLLNDIYLNKDLWMWKDPRTSLLVPLWSEILKDLNIKPHYIICI